MIDVLGAIGLVTVAAVTPGPNNLIVLRTASRSGIAGALPAIAGVVTGGLAVLAVAQLAAGAVFADLGLREIARYAGALYLAWLGASLVRYAGRADHGHTRGLPTPSLSGLFAFQFLNPKSWVMVATAIAASPGATWWSLAAVFVAIPTACLMLWATAGAALARLLARPRVALWVDRAMGIILVATAVALVVVP